MATFFLFFGSWILWSGKFDSLHLTLGGIAAGLVTLSSRGLSPRELPKHSIQVGFTEFVRLLRYLFWLFKEVAFANLHVLHLSLHPRVLSVIDPRVIVFRTKLRGDLPRFLLAQSITLTPGTVTIRIIEDEFTVHAISAKMARGLPGEMEERIKQIFTTERGSQ